MTQIAGEVLLQTVKLSLRRRALQKSGGGRKPVRTADEDRPKTTWRPEK